jgi:hypothetical protein
MESEVAPRLQRLFSLDLRSLAIFRIALGTALLADLCARATELDAFFTDQGVLPRAQFAAVNTPWAFSLFLASGSAWGAALLLGVTALAALALLLGLHTRLATAVTAVLWLSLRARNVYVDCGGDVLVQALLFWSLFLPLGARFSLDRLRAGNPTPAPVTTQGVAPAALLLQLYLVYALAAVHKSRSPAWLHGEMLWYVTHLDQLATPLGRWLGGHTALCHLGTWAALLLELVGPVLLFVPLRIDRLRTLAAAGFIGLHLGFVLVLRLGLFPWYGMVAWLGVVPFGVHARLGAGRLADWIAPRAWRWRLSLAGGPEPRTALGRWGARLCLLAMAVVVLWNIATVVPALQPVLEAGRPAMDVVGLNQNWLMFDGPQTADGWFVAAATLEDGHRVDLLTGGPVRLDRPNDFAVRFGSQRNTSWQVALSFPENEALLPGWAAWLCRSWNQLHPASRARELELDWMQEETLPDREAPPVRTERLRGRCLEAP